MKTKSKITFLWGIILLFAFTACENEIDELPGKNAGLPATERPSDIPEGYFEVTFTSGTGNTKAPVSGSDGRVRHIHYVIYKETGEYVKEKIVLLPSDAVPSWPLAAIKDTLPKGNYKAVFLGNVEKTLFPYSLKNSPVNYSEVLTDYKTSYAAGRIVLPNAEFKDNTEYYFAGVAFSDKEPEPYVLLQRIISMLKVHRNFIDAQVALNKLTNNIFTNINYKNLIQAQVQNVLPGLLRSKLLGVILVGLDGVVNTLTSNLVTPVTNALYDILLAEMVNQIGLALTGNANQQGTLAYLGVLLNPWAQSEAKTALVTIRDFPKTMDFGLNVQSKFDGDHLFRFDFPDNTVYDEKDLYIKGFHGLFNIRKINVIKTGLLSGVVMDQIVDNALLLNGAFIDVTDSLKATVATNYRYEADYSFLDLKLKSYTLQTDGAQPLSISVQIGKIANIDGILNGLPLLGTVISLLLAPVKEIQVTVPVNLPLLGVDNLSLSGSWSAVTPY